MLIELINLYPFIPLSVIMILAWGYKIGGKQNMLASFFLYTFQLFWMNFHVVLGKFKLKILVLFMLSRDITAS